MAKPFSLSLSLCRSLSLSDLVFVIAELELFELLAIDQCHSLEIWRWLGHTGHGRCSLAGSGHGGHGAPPQQQARHSSGTPHR